MAQKITLKIAGKDYSLPAQSPAEEQNMRIAASKINSQLERYNSMVGLSDFDKLALVSLTYTMEMLRLTKSENVLESSIQSISAELKSYLEGIDR